MTVFLNFSVTQKLKLKMVAKFFFFFFITSKQVLKGLNPGVIS